MVRVQFVNFFDGFTQALCRSHVLMELCREYEFIFADPPDVLLVGCYGQKPIEPTRAVRVGYYTENLPPDLDNCDYFFGCEYSHLIDHPRYCKRVYGPLDPALLDGCRTPEAALACKSRFANFIYSSESPFRERFFRHLARYGDVTAPGRRMTNSSELTARSTTRWREEKLEYLRRFKFTVAFENGRRPGYATEKLYDAFLADSVPIYWGDPELETIVNRDAVIWVDADWELDVLAWARLPERRVPLRPYYREPSLRNKAFGRANDLIGWLRARIPYTRGFRQAIDEVRALDADDRAYCQKLAAPRLKPSIHRIRAEYLEFWRQIIAVALARRA